MEINSVGVVGLGATGSALAHRLLARGFDVTAYDRDAGRVAAAVAAGARGARIPADAAESADLVFLRMPDEAAVEEVLFDCGGVGDTLRDGGYVVDASVTGSAFARSAAARLAQLGLNSVEAWLVGRAGQPPNGAVRVVAGCDTAHLEVIAPVLRAVAGDITRVGPVGSVAALRLMVTVLYTVHYSVDSPLPEFAANTLPFPSESEFDELDHGATANLFEYLGLLPYGVRPGSGSAVPFIHCGHVTMPQDRGG